MRYFFDTEFSERGRRYPLVLISIGIVADDGREFYAESDEFTDADCNEWVVANVLPKLHGPRLPVPWIAEEIVRFVGIEKPEFWAYYADYDWVVLCQLFGTMMDLPKGWPMWCRDLKQLASSLGDPQLPQPAEADEHNALADARWVRDTYNALTADSEGVGT